VPESPAAGGEARPAIVLQVAVGAGGGVETAEANEYTLFVLVSRSHAQKQ
jgi:hypothetical protein